MMGLGAFGIDWFRKRVGKSYEYPGAPYRSVQAITSKINRVAGGYRFSRGAYTLTALSGRSGYHAGQLRRAQAALNQKWKRTSLRGSFLITDDQAEELLAWLQRDFWSRKRRLYCCVQCGDDQVPPKVWGLCRRCYHRVRDATTKLRTKELSTEDQVELDRFLQVVKSGRGFQWRHLRVMTRRLRSRSPGPS
jgi:hypothetical protein